MGVTVAENEKRECALQSYCLVFVYSTPKSTTGTGKKGF